MADSPVQRILIVEDEPMLAYALEELVTDAGFEIGGVASSLDRALAIVESDACDAAILDTNLAGVSSAPLVSVLTARGIPFVVLSGYSPSQQNSAFAGALRLQKPCPPEKIILALRSILPANPDHP